MRIATVARTKPSQRPHKMDEETESERPLGVRTAFRRIQPVAFERTFHVLDGINDVVVHHFLILDTDTAATVALL